MRTIQPSIDLSALDRITDIEQRVRLMISYLQLFKHRVVDGALPRHVYVNLLRDATPRQRVSLTIKLLDVQSHNPSLGVEIPTELLVLAVYETTGGDELAHLIAHLPWTEPVRAAIEDVSAVELEEGKRRTIPFELRVTRRMFGDPETPVVIPRLDVGAMLRIGKAKDVLATLGNYRRLRVAGVITERIQSSMVARVLETIRDANDRIAATDWAYRAGLLTATHFGRTVVHAIDDIDDAEQLMRTQVWYLQMFRLGVVHEALPAAPVARSLRTLLAEESFEQFQALMELLPEHLIDDLSIQAALETDPRAGIRSGDTAPHAAVPGALWQSIREVA
jgi:hypothetical protein